MSCMYIDRGWVVKVESKLGCLWVVKEGTLIQGRLSYVLYVY